MIRLNQGNEVTERPLYVDPNQIVAVSTWHHVNLQGAHSFGASLHLQGGAGLQVNESVEEVLEAMASCVNGGCR